MNAKRAMRETLRGLMVLTTGAIVVGASGMAGAAEQRIDWVNPVNVTIRGNGLQKTGGCQGCDDATAVSRQMIRGDGYVEFVVGEPYTFWLAGLSNRGSSAHFNDIDYAFRFNGNDSLDVMENGQYQGGDTDYAPGDRFRIAVVGGRVQYMKNDRVVFQSRRPPRYPLVFAAALGTMGASLRNAQIETAGAALTRNDYDGRQQRDNDYYGRQRRDDNAYGRRGTGAVGTSGQLITVSANERWTDTGLWVEAGDLVTIDAQGRIQMSADPNDVATPAGAPSRRFAPEAPMRNSAAGTLLARFGNGPAVAVGDRRTVRAPAGGELYLGVNDDVLQDNRGAYRVSIGVQPR